MLEHIKEEVLLDFVERRVDPVIAARVQAHLDAGCASCGAHLSQWQRLLPALRADMAPGVPPVVRQRAFALFTPKMRQPSVWNRMVAALVFDSRQQRTLAGARDAQRDTFKLLFSADGTDVDLLCERNGSHWNIAGQVLCNEMPELGWSVIAASETSHVDTHSDALGEFHIGRLTHGTYALTLQGMNREIVLQGIAL